MDFNQKLKELSEIDFEAYHLAQMRELVQFHYNNNSVYRRMCEEHCVNPDDIRSLSDVSRLPIVEQDYLSTHSFFHEDPEKRGGSIPMNELRTFLNSCGSTGKPKRIPIADIAVQSIYESTALALWLAGVRGFHKPNGGPILPITLHGPSAGCFYMQNGSEIIGFAPKSDVNLPFEWHYDNLVDLQPKYVITTPSYIAALGQYISEHGDFDRVNIDVIVLGGEYFSESFRSEIADMFGAQVFDIYGCAETQIIGVESEELRRSHPGFLHHMAHMSYIEVVEPGTSRLVEPGEEGELVISVFNRRAWPVIRYRMGDIVRVPPPEEVGSGVGFPLLSRVGGRVGDRLIYGESVLNPSALFDSIDAFNQRQPRPLLSSDKFQVVVDDDEDGVSHCILYIERISTIEDSEAAGAQLLECLYENCSGLESSVAEFKSVSVPKIEIVSSGDIYVNEQKLKRFVDKRIKKGC